MDAGAEATTTAGAGATTMKLPKGKFDYRGQFAVDRLDKERAEARAEEVVREAVRRGLERQAKIVKESSCKLPNR